MRTEEEIEKGLEEANEWLRTTEPGSIEVVHRNNNTFTGYRVAFIREALDRAFGPFGWRIQEESVAPDQTGERIDEAVVHGVLEVRLPSSGGFPEKDAWFSKGKHSGAGTQPKGNMRDAVESARSDLLKKAAADWGIGKRAYRGELPVPSNDSQEAPRPSGSGAKGKPWEKYRGGPPETGKRQAASLLKDHLTRVSEAAGRKGWGWIFAENKDRFGGLATWDDVKRVLPGMSESQILDWVSLLEELYPPATVVPELPPPDADLNLDDLPF